MRFIRMAIRTYSKFFFRQYCHPGFRREDSKKKLILNKGQTFMEWVGTTMIIGLVMAGMGPIAKLTMQGLTFTVAREIGDTSGASQGSSSGYVVFGQTIANKFSASRVDDDKSDAAVQIFNTTEVDSLTVSSFGE